ncbi:MAG: hypothetical protein AAF797_17820 [Planctomycetota bacterium]
MSDHIAHLAICDDVTRLAAVHPDVEPDLAAVLTQFRDDAHLGTITRHADKWSAELLAGCRDAIASADPIDPNANRSSVDGGYATGPLPQRKLAFILGSLTHRAADRLTKPITHSLPKSVDTPPRFGSGNPANESKILQDLLVFKEVYASGRPDNPTSVPGLTQHVLTALTGEPEANAELLFRTLLRRALIAMHTLNPDDDHPDAWIEQLLTRLQTYPKSMYQYAQLAAEWPQDKVRQYLTEPNFYCREDTLIQTARALQHGSSLTPEQVADAHQQTPFTDAAKSRYARALSRALDYLLVAGQLYRKEIDTDTARTGFDVGVPELAVTD